MTPPLPPPLPRDLPVGAALARLRAAFAAAGLDAPGADARALARLALGLDAAALARAPERPLGDGAAPLAALAARRLAREPLARILGAREFWGLPFALAPETLVPRPDSEAVVAAALGLLPAGRAARVLDLGTGTGCLLVALLSERPLARGLGVDRAEGAARAARGNAARNGVGARAAFLVADWAAPLAGGARFDLVISNPPYVRGRDLAGLEPEVARHDPAAALDGGADGLDAYRAITAALPALLAPGGAAVLELGAGQGPAVAALARAAGLLPRPALPDLAGVPRALPLLAPV